MMSIIKYIFLLTFSIFCYPQNKDEVTISSPCEVEALNFNIQSDLTTNHFIFYACLQPKSIERIEVLPKERRVVNRNTYKILLYSNGGILPDFNTSRLYAASDVLTGNRLNLSAKTQSYKYIFFRMLLI